MALREDLVSLVYIDQPDSVHQVFEGRKIAFQDVGNKQLSVSSVWALVVKVISVKENEMPDVDFVWKRSLEVPLLLHDRI